MHMYNRIKINTDSDIAATCSESEGGEGFHN